MNSNLSFCYITECLFRYLSVTAAWMQAASRLSFSHEMLCSLQEAYFRYMAENPTAGMTQEEEEENIDYDSDGNPIAPATKKIILPLPPIDHSEVHLTILIEHRQFKSIVSTMDLILCL